MPYSNPGSFIRFGSGLEIQIPEELVDKFISDDGAELRDALLKFNDYLKKKIV